MNVQNLIDGSPRSIARDVDRSAPAVAAASDAASAANAEAALAADQAGQSARVRAAAMQLDSYLKSSGRSLEFRVDERSGRVVVKVHDSSTGEVIRQIPNEETLRIADRLADPLNGGGSLLDLLA